MEANELRIGNFFHPCYKKDGILMPDESTVYQVGYIDIFGNIMPINTLTNSITFKPPEYIGVTLTKDWLKRFGKIQWLSKDIDGYFVWVNGDKIYIKFVHTLQNMYFCIEQKELT